MRGPAEGKAEGRAEGRAEGFNQLSKLIELLSDEERYADIKKIAKDAACLLYTSIHTPAHHTLLIPIPAHPMLPTLTPAHPMPPL